MLIVLKTNIIAGRRWLRRAGEPARTGWRPAWQNHPADPLDTPGKEPNSRSFLALLPLWPPVTFVQCTAWPCRAPDRVALAGPGGGAAAGR